MLVGEGYPTLSLMALSINNLRFALPESDDLFVGALNQQSVMGVVKGYDGECENPYWLIDVSVIPCETLELRLPMTRSGVSFKTMISETNKSNEFKRPLSLSLAQYSLYWPLHLSFCSHHQQF